MNAKVIHRGWRVRSGDWELVLKIIWKWEGRVSPGGLPLD